ncbi:protein FAM3D [Synchiropus picturatus]
MRSQALFFLSALMVVGLMTWGLSIVSSVIQKSRSVSVPAPKCGLATLCTADQFPVHVSSGAADIVGPKICFNGKIIMSHVLNNVGLGLNIVVVNISSGSVESSTVLNMKNGAEKDILQRLNSIKPGMMVLVASFGDVTLKMSDEIREAFVGMGSSLVSSLKYRDNWVFVGRGVTGDKSLFEKRSVNDAKTNVYDTYPAVAEVAGCFPKD